MSELAITLTVDALSVTQLSDQLNFADLQTITSTLTNLLQGQAAGSQPLTELEIVTEAVAASGSVTFRLTGPVANDTVTINGVTFTGKASGASGNEWNVSTTPATNATRLAAAINASVSVDIADVITATASGDSVLLVADTKGADGNDITLAKSATNTNVSGSTFTGGIDSVKYIY